MPSEFDEVFAKLSAILRRNTGTLTVKESPGSFALEGQVGPAALKVWGGKMKKPTMPVAWVAVGKAYVSFHVMGLYGTSKTGSGMSKELAARMQGKTCFNFKSVDEALFKELEQLTVRSFKTFKKAGFVA